MTADAAQPLGDQSAGDGDAVPAPIIDPKHPRPPISDRLRARRLDGRVVLVGVVIGFVACVIAGWHASRHSPYANVQRFQAPIGPEANFFPTSTQLADMVQRRGRRDSVFVVVGGNSILYGTGMPADKVWTRTLQQLLGPPFVVVNLALRGSVFPEGGAVIAEMLLKRGRRVIYVGNSYIAGNVSPFGQRYQYLFWDAYYKHQLLTDPLRDAMIKKALKVARASNDAHDLILGQRLNSYLFFNDLWTDVTYRHFSTTWNSTTYPFWWAARKLLPDRDATPTMQDRYRPADNDNEMRIVRSTAEGLFVKDANGQWTINPASGNWPAMDRENPRALPKLLRDRTLLIAVADSPHYVRQLSPDLQVEYAMAVTETVRRLQGEGYHAMSVGLDYPEEDYCDRSHLAPNGGGKMAAAVAPAVRSLAAELGHAR